MILAVDVQYRDPLGFAAGVTFAQWDAAVAAAQYFATTHDVAPYVPGQFYQREQPCILNLLERLPEPPDCIVVDGFVFLDDNSARPGLGKHLYDALGAQVPVIGVAKTAFHGADDSGKLLRARSQRPLYVSCVGCPLDEAREHIARMHGEGRIPFLLKYVDQLCRQAATAPPPHIP